MNGSRNPSHISVKIWLFPELPPFKEEENNGRSLHTLYIGTSFTTILPPEKIEKRGGNKHVTQIRG
jgi:hypothetical protein